MTPYRIIHRKKNGAELSAEEIAVIVEGAARGTVPDIQLVAWLMAVCWQGMTASEVQALTSSMLHSGDVWEWPDDFPFWADKHSTGGVGDKVSLLLAPWVAAAGVPVGMLSGRGLGHTGGTLDKLETISGFRVDLERDEFGALLRGVGCAVAAASAGLVPADRKLYALRDATATVESLPLITASIMSKKLAVSPRALVLDIKVGSGAFMPDAESARRLALSLLSVAKGFGLPAAGLLTAMDVPLGATAGNACEVVEVVQALAGRGPRDLVEVTRAQGVEILLLAGVANDAAAASQKLDAVLASGAAAARFRDWVEAQGGILADLDRSSEEIGKRSPIPVRAARGGVVQRMDTRALGLVAAELGAGRRHPGDRIDPWAGLRFLKKTGDSVEAGEPLLEFWRGERPCDLEAIATRSRECYEIGAEPATRLPLIIERLAP